MRGRPHPSRTQLLGLLPVGLVGDLAGCAEGGQQTEDSTLTMLAVSSLTDSSELLARSEQGPPADVFASADEANMDNAVEEEDIRDQIQVIEMPEHLNVLAAYPIVIIEGALEFGSGARVVDLVLSDKGQGVFEEYGFTPVS